MTTLLHENYKPIYFLLSLSEKSGLGAAVTVLCHFSWADSRPPNLGWSPDPRTSEHSCIWRRVFKSIMKLSEVIRAD